MNYWVLGTQGIAEYTTFLTPVDGDLSKVTLVDGSIDIGNKPIRRTTVMYAGREVSTEFLPSQVSSDGKIENVGDLSTVHNRLTVSAAFKSVVEEIAPGDVQYVPFDVVGGKSGDVQAQRFWFIPTVRLFAMDKQKTKPGFSEKGFFEFGRPWEEMHIVFDARVTAGKPIFASAEFPGIFFVSDEFVQAVEAASLNGARLMRKFPSN